MSDAIPAPGFQTFQGRARPHLVTEALLAVRRLAAGGTPTPPPAFALLVILCDAVEASHGQWYGSIEKLAARSPWSRRWFTKWLPVLVTLGLVERIEGLPGRKLATYQVLPDVYRLVSTTVPTSADDAEVPESAWNDAADLEHPFHPLVSTPVPPPCGNGCAGTCEHNRSHEHLTPIEHQEEHPLTVATPIQKSTPCAWCESTSCSGSQREEHGRLRAKQLLIGVVKDIA